MEKRRDLEVVKMDMDKIASRKEKKYLRKKDVLYDEKMKEKCEELGIDYETKEGRVIDIFC